jgi:hypothetical protein
MNGNIVNSKGIASAWWSVPTFSIVAVTSSMISKGPRFTGYPEN